MLVHQSSTRRKSCSACVKAKRRCDLRLPSCSRCQKRHLTCSFARVREGRIAEESLQTEVPTNRRKGKEVARTSIQNRVSPPLSVSVSAGPVRDIYNYGGNTVLSPGGFSLSNADFGDNQNPDQYISRDPIFDQIPFTQPYLDVDLRDFDFSTYPNANVSNTDWPSSTCTGISLPPSLQYPTIINIGKPQLDYSVKHFRSCIQSLVSTGHAPFIHDAFNLNCPLGSIRNRAIYQDLLTVCSLQTCRNKRNASTINTIMNSKVTSLIESSPKERPVLDLLASVQALIVYQIIRLFNDDEEQRAIAERQSAYLYSWTTTLQNYSAPYQRYIAAHLSPWQEWIVSESIRRTVVMSILLKGCYSNFKFGTCEDVPVLSRLPVSDKGSFWRLGEEEWKERLEIDGSEPKQFPYKKFVEEWTNGNVKDVDEFGSVCFPYEEYF